MYTKSFKITKLRILDAECIYVFSQKSFYQTTRYHIAEDKTLFTLSAFLFVTNIEIHYTFLPNWPSSSVLFGSQIF
jgi:hypothetical protein